MKKIFEYFFTGLVTTLLYMAIGGFIGGIISLVVYIFYVTFPWLAVVPAVWFIYKLGEEVKKGETCSETR